MLVVFALAGVSGCSDEEDGACLGFALECGQREPAQCKQGYDGCAVLNGPAARLGEVGDKIIVLCYGLVDNAEAPRVKVSIVKVDERNRATSK